MYQLHPTTIAATILETPWHLFRQVETLPVFKEGPVGAIYVQKAQEVLHEAVNLCQANPDQRRDPSTVATVLLLDRIFSHLAERRDEALRGAFEDCLEPDYRADFMTQGTSTYIWFQTRCEFRNAMDAEGDPVAEAMVDMLDTLKQEVQDLRMGMVGDAPAILWADLLTAVGARNGHKAQAMLQEFVDDEYAKPMGVQSYVLIDSLIWTVPKMVVGLSRKPKEKRHLVDAGYRIFSATLRSRAEDIGIVTEVIKKDVQGNGLGVIQEAETEARYALSSGQHHGAPVFIVNEDQDGNVKVRRHKQEAH